MGGVEILQMGTDMVTGWWLVFWIGLLLLLPACLALLVFTVNLEGFVKQYGRVSGPPGERAAMSDTATPQKVLDSLPAAVSPDCPHAKQMVSNNLRYHEQHFHNDLMRTPVNQWPESLTEAVDARQRKMGLCGDVISTAVADWIRHDLDV